MRGAKKRIFAEMSVLAWLAAKTSFVKIVGFYGSGSVKTLPVLLLYYRLQKLLYNRRIGVYACTMARSASAMLHASISASPCGARI